MLLCFIYLCWDGKINQERKVNIESTGIETIGTVINKGVVRSPHVGASYDVTFDFEHDDERIVCYQSLYYNKWYYDNAIIGMKYKVKYLPHEPQRNAIIYIEKPIVSEYANIEKEKERIFNTYGE